MPSRSGRRSRGPSPTQVVRTRNIAMRTSERIVFALMLGIAPLVASAPSFAFDGAPINQEPGIPVATAQSGAAANLRKAGPQGTAALPDSNSITALQYAADEGHPVAQWKLGRMYANGEGGL